jgi:pilus assembly protein Flp/PilA
MNVRRRRGANPLANAAITFHPEEDARKILLPKELCLSDSVARSRLYSKGATTMFSVVKRFLKDEAGVTAIEYGLIAAMIAVAAITVTSMVGQNLSTTFQSVTNSF